MNNMTDRPNLQELIPLLEQETLTDPEWTRLHEQAIQQVSHELARCADWLKLKNSRLAEAYGHSESCGNLITQMERIDEISDTRSMQGKAGFSATSRDNADILNRAYIIFRRSETVFFSYRKSCLNRRPMGERLARICLLAGGEDMKIWQAGLTHEIDMCGDDLKDTLAALCQNEKHAELKTIEKALENATGDDRKIEHALNATRSEIEKSKKTNLISEKNDLVLGLRKAYDGQILMECLHFLKILNSTKFTDLIEFDDQAVIDDVRNWSDQEVGKRDRLHEYNVKVRALENAMDDGASTAQLEHIYLDLNQYDERIPEAIESRYHSQVKATERTERVKMKTLVAASVLVVAIALIGTAGWLGYSTWQGGFTRTAQLVVADCESGRIQEARDRYDALIRRNGAKRNLSVQQALIVLENSEERQNKINAKISALLESVPAESREIEWYDTQLGRLSGLLLEAPGEEMRLNAAEREIMWRQKRELLVDEELKSYKSRYETLNQEVLSVKQMMNELPTRKNAEMMALLKSYQTEAIRINELSNILRKEPRLSDDLESKLTEVSSRSSNIANEAKRKVESIGPGIKLLTNLQTNHSPAALSDTMEKLIRNHGDLIVQDGASLSDWREALDAARSGESIMVWMNEIRPVLAAVDGDLLKLAPSELDSLVDICSRSESAFLESPLKGEITVIRSLNDSRDLMEQRPPNERYAESLEELRLDGIIIATVENSSRKKPATILGRGVTKSNAQKPFDHWLSTIQGLRLALIQLPTGESAMKLMKGRIERFRSGSEPAEWEVSREVSRTLDQMPNLNSIESQFEALALIDRIGAMPIANPAAKYWLASRLWETLGESFAWPKSAYEDTQKKLNLSRENNSRANNYDWIRGWYSPTAFDRFAEEAARTGMAELPSTEEIRRRILLELGTLKEALRIGPPIGLIQAGARNTRATPGIPDGTYLTMARATQQAQWTFTRIRVVDGYATLVPDDVPHGPAILYEIRN